MGCGSSRTIENTKKPDIKENKAVKLENEVKAEFIEKKFEEEEEHRKRKLKLKESEEEKTVYADKLPERDQEEMTGSPIGTIKTLENYDLLEKFLLKPRCKNYLEQMKQNKTLNDEDNKFANLFDEIKSEFEELFKRFNVEYTIPTEDFIIDVGSYKLECKPSSQADLDLFLPFFFLEMCLYPKSFLVKSQVKSFIFVNTLQFSTSEYSQYRAAVPEYNQTFALYYCTKERSTGYIRQVLHHEFFHYVDWTDDWTYEDKQWRTFNPQNFEYGQGGAFEREWKALDPECRGFIAHYATTALEEDKAEIFRYFMENPKEAMKNEDEIIRKKVNYLLNWLRKYDTLGMGKPKFLGSLVDFRRIHNY